jgi:hypothetical protein
VIGIRANRANFHAGLDPGLRRGDVGQYWVSASKNNRPQMTRMTQIKKTSDADLFWIIHTHNITFFRLFLICVICVICGKLPYFFSHA